MKRVLAGIAASAVLISLSFVHHSDARPQAPRVEAALSVAGPSDSSDLRDIQDLKRASRSRPVATPKATVKPTVKVAPKPKLVARGHVVVQEPSSAYAWAHSSLAIRYANCESGDRSPGVQGSYNGGSKGVHLSDNPRYRGKWQIGYGEWRGTGGSGDPADASESEQDYRAWILWKARGWQPWLASYRCAHR